MMRVGSTSAIMSDPWTFFLLATLLLGTVCECSNNIIAKYSDLTYSYMTLISAGASWEEESPKVLLNVVSCRPGPIDFRTEIGPSSTGTRYS